MKAKVWERTLRFGLIGISAVYAFVLIKIILLKSGITPELRTIQYVPLSFIKDLTNPELALDVVLKNVLGNFAIFIPLGILLPILFNELSYIKTVFIGLFISIFFETLQYIVGFGMTDIDDLILNTLGCMTGAALYFALFNRPKKQVHTELISFIFLAVFGCCGVLSLWLYQPSALPAQVVYENEAIFGGVDRDSYDISAVCSSLENGSIFLKENSSNAAGNASQTNVEAKYKLSDDAFIIADYRSYQYSPNGNIQKTTVSYKISNAQTAAKDIKNADGAFIDIWLNENNDCIMMVYTIFEAEQ